MPTSGEGRYWYVGDVDGATGQVTIKNTIQSNAPGNRKDVMPPKENRAVTSWYGILAMAHRVLNRTL